MAILQRTQTPLQKKTDRRSKLISIYRRRTRMTDHLAKGKDRPPQSLQLQILLE